MSRKLRLSSVPAIVGVVSGKLHWFDKHFSVQHLRDFVRALYPPDLILEVHDSFCRCQTTCFLCSTLCQSQDAKGPLFEIVGVVFQRPCHCSI